MTMRQTFREMTTAVAWQKQLRDRYASEGTPPALHLALKRAEVRRVSYHLAQQIILKYEWLGTMAKTSHHYGLFFGPYCAGVTCVGFSAGSNVNAASEFQLARHELAYLARGACVHWAPQGANSKLIAWTCRLLARETGAKLVIAYADTDAGEIGTIYQACNWAYVGLGEATLDWIAPSGRLYKKKYSDTLAKKHGGTMRLWIGRLEQAGWQRFYSNPKHRYVSILGNADRALRDRIARLCQPYPKRATSIGADASADQAEEGGASPTVALPLHGVT
jgi:hypothetical protein